MKLNGQTAIVTGAGRGIGRATALAFAREGANVVLAARSVSEIEAVADEIRSAGQESLPVPTDVSNKSEVESMVKQTLDRFGKVDILVNNAGVAIHNPIPLIREEDWTLTSPLTSKRSFSARRPFLVTCVSKDMGISSTSPLSPASTRAPGLGPT